MTTSLTVVPAARLMAMIWSRGSRVIATRRCGVIAAFHDTRRARPPDRAAASWPFGGRGRNRAIGSSPGVRRTVSTNVSPKPASCSSMPWRARLATRPGKRATWRSWSTGPSNIRPTRFGGSIGGCGWTWRFPAASGSSRAVITSAPVTPSIAAMWILAYRATRSSRRPSMTHSSHSGRERSSGTAWRRAIRRPSAAASPGGARPVWRRWNSRSKPSTGPHDGRPSPNGTSTTTRWAEVMQGQALFEQGPHVVVREPAAPARPEDRHTAEVARLGRALHRQEGGVHRSHPAH